MPADFPQEPPEYLYQETNLEYEDQPDHLVTEPLPEPPLKEVPVLTTEEKKVSKEEKSEKWESFVKFVEESADKSLVSLMRNSVLLEITDESLTIGLQNTRLFTEEKRKQVEACAQSFFQMEFTIRYEDSVDGLDDSVREKIEQERIKAEEETKKKAAESSNVQEILALFPNSKIKNIEILKEEKDV